jgi:hypothetical protein
MTSRLTPDLPINNLNKFVNAARQVNLAADGPTVHNDLADGRFDQAGSGWNPATQLANGGRLEEAFQGCNQFLSGLLCPFLSIVHPVVKLKKGGRLRIRFWYPTASSRIA